MVIPTQQPEGAHYSSNRTTTLLFLTPAWFLTSSDSKPKSFQWPPRATAISGHVSSCLLLPSLHSSHSGLSALQTCPPCYHPRVFAPAVPWADLLLHSHPTEHIAHLSPPSSSCPHINVSARPPPISLFTNTATPAPTHPLSSPHPTLLSVTYT